MSVTGFYSLFPRNTVILEKLTVPQFVNKFLAFYGTWRFITVFTTAHHLSLPIHPSSFKLIFSPLNAELNSTCNLLVLLGAHHIHHVSTIRVKSSLPTMPFFSKRSLFLRFYHQNPICNIFLPLTCHKSCTSCSPWFDHLDKIFGEEHNRRALHQAIFSHLLLFPLS